MSRSDPFSGLEARLQSIRDRVEAAARRSGRTPESVRLIAVSKRQPVEAIRRAYAAGQRDFGENQVQEAEGKRPILPDDVVWHLLGPLQSNKSARAADLFACFHALDRAKIARRLDRHAAEAGRRLDVFAEINLGAESSKHGLLPDRLETDLRPLADLRHLRWLGLMAIPPRDDTPRRWFERLARLRDRVATWPEWSEFGGRLSMGMSADFDEAIACGATEVRVGTEIFGPRPPA
ncbi:MAG: YggS family pyridoxal phosphate-dependent enzyme [Acidobacteriota bacterium]